MRGGAAGSAAGKERWPKSAAVNGMANVSVRRGRRLVLEAGLFIGAGFAALIHNIVFRQLLGWYHVVPGARLGLFFDGLLALAAVTLVSLGLVILMRARTRLDTPRVPRRLAGAVLLGAGGFQIFDSLVSQLAGLQRVPPTENPLLWDASLVLVGVLFTLMGALVLRRVARESSDQERGSWPPPPREDSRREKRATGQRGLRGSRL